MKRHDISVPCALALLLGFLLVISLTPESFAQSEYKTYVRPQREIKWLRIEYSSEMLRITTFRGDTVVASYDLPPSSLDDLGTNKSTPPWRIEKNNLIVGEELFDLQLITKTRIEGDPSEDRPVMVTFYTSSKDDERSRRERMGNVVTDAGTFTVKGADFVRGSVVNTRGNVVVKGEVNGDVIVFAGDVEIGKGAVVRGDVVAFTGRIDIDRDATIYGETFAPEVLGRSKVAAKFRQGFSIIESFDYNRVDGLRIGLGGRFDDIDSLVPSLWFEASYATETERGRYDIGFEQTLSRRVPIAVGASAFRELANEDDWITDPTLHFVYPLLVAEDYRDYYEAEGGMGWVSFKPMGELTVELGYRFEETRYFDAHPLLWSLFGWDKEFRANYSTVEPGLRQTGSQMLENADNGFVFSRIAYDTRFLPEVYEHPAWHVTGELEWSTPDLDSDYDYRRYRLMVRRYQPVHERGMVLLRGVFGGSDGYLPMHKRWFLGGLSTLEGYNHREFVGTRFWMTNAEYRFSFEKFGLAGGVYYDAAQVANETKLNGDVEVKQSIGIAAYVDDLRIGLSQRLDGAEKDDPRLYVRLSHTF